MRGFIRAAFFILLTQVCALAGAGAADKVIAKVETVAGPLTIVETEDSSVDIVKLKGETQLYKAETYGAEGAGLRVAKVFKAFGPGEDLIFLSESDGGTQCRATYVLLSLKADGTYHASEAFGNCAAPAFVKVGERLFINFPKLPGSPAETWVYEGGKLSKSRAKGRRG